VVIAVALCFIVGGLLLFFLFPRAVSLTSTQPALQPTNIYVNVSANILSFTVTVRLRHVTVTLLLILYIYIFIHQNGSIKRKKKKYIHTEYNKQEGKQK